nr:MAG TPA: hypothetical protein [Caudoviricetes sp.]
MCITAVGLCRAFHKWSNFIHLLLARCFNFKS